MKYLTLIIVFLVVHFFVASCSTPADNWSCSKLKSEIKRCEKNIYASKYNYDNGAMSYEQYRKNVKAFEDAIEHYKEKLNTCNDKPLNTTNQTTEKLYSSQTTNQVDGKNKENELTNNNVEIEGSWSSIEAREYGILKTTFEKKELNKYMEISKLIDGSKHIGRLELNNRGEYLTNNKFGEYYKFIGYSLGCYDRDGLIYVLDKN